MSQQELVREVVAVLENAEIEYMLTGSVASSLQGEPRSTHDIDLVVALEAPAVDKLLAAFPSPRFYLDKGSILEAIKMKDMFNLLDVEQGDKVDFWILTDSPFDQSRFAHRYTEELEGLKIVVSSPEDTILAKLRWAKLSGGSDKQFTDALRVYEVQSEKLDMDYLNLWAGRLYIEGLWQKLQNEAEV